jgi:16S rRNA (cytidine1402-2'-O)-methyltransferase
MALLSSGTLYIVSGPIGNLQDFTYRAVETLKSVDLVLSEDTRETTKLLDAYGVKVSQISYRDQNHDHVFAQILDLLGSGKTAALVSDSGTPTISDPGYKLVRDLIQKGIKVSPVPGPSAIIAALSASGLPTDKFSFLGFLPKKEGPRIKLLSAYGALDNTLIIYESPYRIHKLLEEIKLALGNRRVTLARELTKLHEEIVTDFVENLLSQEKTYKGEFVVLISKEE